MNLRLRYFIEFYLNEMQHSQTLSIFIYDHITLFDIFCIQYEKTARDNSFFVFV